MIKGHPAFFIMRIDLREIRKNPLIKFPIIFKIGAAGSDAATFKQAEGQGKGKQGFVDIKKKCIQANMDKTDLYISTKNRMPTKDHCDIHIQGLRGIFYFGD